jgi:hypothetical protein
MGNNKTRNTEMGDPSDSETRHAFIESLTTDEIMAIRLTGVSATQNCVITESGTNGDGVQFRGSMVIDYGNRSVGDVLRRCTSNVVIASAPMIRKHIMDYRSKKTVSVNCPAPGSRERSTAITTQSDVESFLCNTDNIDDDTLAAIVATVTERRNINA